MDIRKREDQEAQADREARPYVIGEVANPGVIERFPTHAEAVAWMEAYLDSKDVENGRYYIDGPEDGA